MGRDDPTTPTSLPIHLRIRRRREERGLSGVELAERAGVSPPYVSLIEKGVKIPDEDVAVAIARALGDDVILYRAWARAKRYGADLESASKDLQRAYRYSSDRTLRQKISRGEDLDEQHLESRSAGQVRARRSRALAREVFSLKPMSVHEAAFPKRDALVSVPVYAAGVDPGDGIDAPTVREEPDLLLDPRLFAIPPVGKTFAFRAGPATVVRVSDEVRAGDWIVIDRADRFIDQGAIQAVRLRGEIVLSRVALQSGAIVLLPGHGRSDVEMLSISEGDRPSKHIVGRVVVVIRPRT